jgi:hypothetical protein
VENSKGGWRVHIRIGNRINAEVNDVKARRYINHWFLVGETCPYVVNIGVKVVWSKPLHPKPGIINATIYHMV